jgi:hypothetical protein
MYSRVVFFNQLQMQIFYVKRVLFWWLMVSYRPKVLSLFKVVAARCKLGEFKQTTLGSVDI